MFYFLDMCVICLEHSNNLIPIKSQDTNGIIIEDKLKYILPKHEFIPNIIRYICVKCGNNLRYDEEFKQKCLKNITTYEKCAQQVTTIDSCYKYSSVVSHPDFVTKKVEICDENTYDTNILESKSEIDVHIVNNEDFIIKEESAEEFVLNNELKSLLHEFKKEYSESDDICNRNENILTKNVPILENMSEQDYEKEISKPDLKQHRAKLNTCDICNKSFGQSFYLKQHKRIHTGEKPFTCEICRKTFRASQSLRYHKDWHFGKRQFTCEVCKKSFICVSNLKQHKLLHNNRERLFICEVCNKSFTRMTGLRKHKLIHTGKKPFACEVCKKSFGRLDTLKKHELIHTGQKPFTCDVCNKSFRQSGELKTHKRIHTGERPYSCEVCNKLFKRLDHLKHHKIIHTGERPYTCEVCNKSYSHSSHLWKHYTLVKIHSLAKFANNLSDI